MKRSKFTISPKDFDLKNTNDEIIGLRNYLRSVEWQIDRCLNEIEIKCHELQKTREELSDKFNSVIDYITEYKNKENKMTTYNNVIEYLTSSNIWLVGDENKVPRRLNGYYEDWDIRGCQSSMKEATEYVNTNPSYHIGVLVNEHNPLLVIDIDNLTPTGIDYVNEHNSFPLPRRLSYIEEWIKSYICEWSLSGKGLHIYILLSERLGGQSLGPNKAHFKNKTHFDCPLCEQIDVYKGNQFVIYTGNTIKDFKLTFETTKN